MKEYTDLIQAAKEFPEAEAFIFDMDGLLFDTEQLFMEQLAIVMKEQGYTLTKEVYCKSLGLAGERLKELMLTTYGENYPFEECGAESRRRVSMVADTVGLRIKPQIVELLSWLQEHHIRCAVASSTNSEHVERYLEKSGICSYFSAVIGGEMVEQSKPEPEIFLLACEKLGVAPDASVVLEDSENGIRGAHRAGTAVVCIPDLKEPDVSVQSYIDVLVRTGRS